MDFADPLRWPTVAFRGNPFDEQGLISVSPTNCLIWDTISSAPTECVPGALSQPNGSIQQTPLFGFNASLLSPENQTVHNLDVEMLIEFEMICKLLVPFRLHSVLSSEFQIIPRTVRQAGDIDCRFPHESQ